MYLWYYCMYLVTEHEFSFILFSYLYKIQFIPFLYSEHTSIQFSWL